MHDVIKHSAQTSINSWIVFSQRNCIFFFRIFYYWSSMRKISVKSKKTVCFQNKRTKNPETLWYILNDLVLFVQFKKREKHTWRSVNFSKVAGWQPATLLKLTLLHVCRNFQICHPSIGGVLTKRAGLEMTFLTAPLLQTNNLFIFNLQWYINH